MSDNPTQYAPIARRKTYELVAEHLTTQIGARQLLPGDVLPPERELVESFQVGRSSVREALRMLESRGLIASNGNGSFSVAEFRNPLNHSLNLLLEVDEASLHELFEVRRIIEGETAALAAARRLPGHVEGMRGAIEEMRGALASEERFIAADLRFHLTVADATGNRVAAHIMHAIRELVQRALGTIYKIPGSPERSLDEHRAIVDAIEAGDSEVARSLMREHLVRVEHDIDAAAEVTA